MTFRGRHAAVGRSRLLLTGVAPLAALLLVACSERTSPVDVSESAVQADVVSSMSLAPGIALLAGAGDISECGTNHNDEATAKILDRVVALDPNARVFTSGDNVYEQGTSQEYAECFDPTWGRHKARMMPALGNHEYLSPDADPSFDYFGEEALGGHGKGYYSFDAVEWHVVVLNDQIDYAPGSEQEQWLRADLAATTRQCVAAVWHQPRFYSHGAGESGVDEREALWRVLYDRGADLIVNGHRHLYERMARQDPDGNADPAGMVQITVGTGGGGLHSEDRVEHPNTEVIDDETFGVLKLFLGSGTYSWVFVPAGGGTFADAGTGVCHGAVGSNQLPTSEAGGPYAAESNAPLELDGTASTDADGTISLHAWDFGDGTTATGPSPSHAYSVPGTYTLTLTVADDDGATATDQATVTVSSPSGISLTGFAQSDELVILHWSGADGSRVDVFRDGLKTRSTTNDGGTGDSPGAPGTYEYRICEQESPDCSNSISVTLEPPPENQPPTADAGGPYAAEVGDSIAFDGTASTDADGSLTAHAWDFGDGVTATGPSPSHAYPATGTYTATLTVTDDDGATATDQATVTVSNASGISLTGFAQSDELVILHWSGADGSRVDIFRDGLKTRSTTNDGGTGDAPGAPGTYEYRICEQESPDCSNSISVTLGS